MELHAISRQSVSQSVSQFVITSVECVPRSLRAEKRIGSTRAGVKLKFPLFRESLGAKAIAAIIAELQQIFATQGPIASHRIASQPIVHCVGNLTVHLCGRLCGMPQASRLRACVTQWEAVDVAVAVAAAAVDVACWCCACGCCCCCCCCYCWWWWWCWCCSLTHCNCIVALCRPTHHCPLVWLLLSFSVSLSSFSSVCTERNQCSTQ